MYSLTVKTLDSRNHIFESLPEDFTVTSLKEKIRSALNIPIERQRLIYCGRVLQDEKRLSDYDNINGKVIHLVERSPPTNPSKNYLPLFNSTDSIFLYF